MAKSGDYLNPLTPPERQPEPVEAKAESYVDPGEDEEMAEPDEGEAPATPKGQTPARRIKGPQLSPDEQVKNAKPTMVHD